MVHCVAPECSNWKSPEVQRSHWKMSIMRDHSAVSRPLILHQSPKRCRLSPSPSGLQHEGCLYLFVLTQRLFFQQKSNGFRKRSLVSRGKQKPGLLLCHCMYIFVWLCLEKKQLLDTVMSGLVQRNTRVTIMKKRIKQQWGEEMPRNSFNDWGSSNHWTENDALRSSREIKNQNLEIK